MTNKMTIEEINRKYPLTKEIKISESLSSPWLNYLLTKTDFNKLKIDDITININILKEYINENKIIELLDCIYNEYEVLKRINKKDTIKSYYEKHKCNERLFDKFYKIINLLLSENKINDHKIFNIIDKDNMFNDLKVLFQNYIYLGIKLRTTIRTRFLYNNTKKTKLENRVFPLLVI